jgi:putative membrane protein
MLFEWVRAFHIIAVIAWMAGMLMLPRLMVYRLESTPGGETDMKMQKAIKSLRKIILTPMLILTWVLGLTLAAFQWPEIMSHGWFHIKLLMVIGISAFHGIFISMNKKIGTEKAPNPKTLRMLNEVPFLMAIVAVIAVVVQPFG